MRGVGRLGFAPKRPANERAGGLCGRSRSSPVCLFLSLHGNRRAGSLGGSSTSAPRAATTVGRASPPPARQASFSHCASVEY